MSRRDLMTDLKKLDRPEVGQAFFFEMSFKRFKKEEEVEGTFKELIKG